MTSVTRPEASEHPDILERIEGNYVATALRQCPDPSFVEGPHFVVVNAGLKSEAYIPLDEFKNDVGQIDVKPGDFVSVAIESLENGYGDTILSRDKAKRLAAWLNLEKALESGELVSGTITGKVKVLGSVGGDYYVEDGGEVDTWPSQYKVQGLYTHIKLVTTVAFGEGETPRARVYGFYQQAM